MKQEKKHSNYAKGWIYAFAHMSVEVACFFFLTKNRTIDANLWALVDFTYDAMAFIPQLFIGMLADKFKKVNIGICGALMILVASLIPAGIPAFLLLTIGNCLVHVDGAEVTLRGAKGKMGPAGIFVAGGSFGVVTGTMLGRAGNPDLVLIPVMMLALTMLILAILPKAESGNVRETARRVRHANGFHCASSLATGVVTLLTFIVIMARSYVGYAIPTAWIKAPWQTILLFCFMGVGKGLGGVLGDIFGARRVGVISLVAAVPFLMFGNDLMVVSLIGVMLFSMTMAISLGVLVSKFPDQPGFAFGITTVALFVGMMPMFFFRISSHLVNVAIVFVLTLSAAAATYFSSSNDNVKNRTPRRFVYKFKK